ncbi:bifunctional DNA-formamidopyrimidine glycosylase/DNA-(apurinic or apyrimidinic site) lyase [Anaeromyxobacter oryzae]|uniref:Formamidopyrimidine-DNA glycosylase n=1 Tax=Anaeromyxobacter oryzae TaxID=2918170 RepID=A0ABN6MVK9_9BACT|nr:bifunctional DNA-formamidopyrimidine glycosylase/DNA-(apurinic or apyrimidinic site) lyase [Anaeromyxobacter oryzae]BDG03862.1 formamidopyrimidine-DNA glycosylase [Anaeromyxobacter oryzae]
MPELPEVEIAARNLRGWTEGRTLVRADPDAKAKRIFRPATPASFAAAVAGARFGEVRRIGKHLLVALEKDAAPVGLLVHLGMTGKWLRREEGDPPTRFSRARLHLDDGSVLHFDDLRLFGRLRVVPAARFHEVPEVAKLGRDPLEHGIDVDVLAEALGRSRLPVKVRIMDQAILPGVGNIYASEALFRAKIDPRRKANDLSRAEARRLAGTVIEAMREGIARQEGPEITYVEEGGENPFLVYAREGEPCPRCKKGRIVRVVQAQRSTFFCPRCQK